MLFHFDFVEMTDSKEIYYLRECISEQEFSRIEALTSRKNDE